MIDSHTFEEAERLFDEGKQHQYVFEALLPDGDCADEIIGFHAHEAVRKTLEAVLCLASVEQAGRKTFVELIDLVRARIPVLPLQLDQVQLLNAFGCGADESLQEAPALDRHRMLECLRGLRRWAELTRDAFDPERGRLREQIRQDREEAARLLGRLVDRSDRANNNR